MTKVQQRDVEGFVFDSMLGLDIDSVVGTLSEKAIVLEDVQILLGLLSVNMDNMPDEEIRYRWEETRRSVRVLDRLMRPAVMDLKTEINGLAEISDYVLEKTRATSDSDASPI